MQNEAYLIATAVFKLREPDTYSHTLRVARSFEDGSPERTVALLHDVLEDASDLIDEHTLREHFYGRIVDAVVLLTHDKDKDGLTYFEYIHGLAEATGKAAELARAVKRADAQDNLNRSLGQPKRQRRYQRVLLILNHGE